MKTVYALLVGVSQYQHINNLDSADYDAERFLEYLKQQAAGNYSLECKILKNGEATKKEVLAHFKTALLDKNAGADDVLIFYFSGHGGQEKAAPYFNKSEFSGKLQNLACHDADLKTCDGFLADKELRWLIHKAAATGAHVLTLFDCCHSGDNTRSVFKKRLVEEPAVERAYTQFAFSKEISQATLESDVLDNVFPQGRHISIAACANHQLAVETIEGGIFTTALLQLLQKSAGDISYLDLKNRIRNYVSSQFTTQVPQVYVAGPEPRDLFKTFLGGAMKDKPLYGNVYYNWMERRWELDMGAIYGITPEWNGAPQKIAVQTGEENAFALIKKVHPAMTELVFEPFSDIKKGEQYQAVVPSLMARQLQISLEGETSGTDLFSKWAGTKQQEQAGVAIHTKHTDADYRILAKDDSYLITLPKDERPLTAQESGYLPASVEGILEKLKSIRKWSFLKDLENPTSLLSKNSLKVEIFADDQPVPLHDDVVKLEFENPNVPIRLKVKLTNQTQQKLYLGAAYLSSLFGVNPNLLQGQVQGVPKDHETWFLAGNAIPVTLEQYIRAFDWEEEIFYVQIVMSTHEFAMELFQQKDLEAPRQLKTKRTTRGMDDLENLIQQVEENWGTRLIKFRLKAK